MQNSIYRLGSWGADWFEIEEFSHDPLDADYVECNLDPTPLRLPKEIIQIKKDLLLEQQKVKEEKGKRQYRNDPTFALAGISFDPSNTGTERKLRLTLRPSEYYTFLSTAMSLDKVLVDKNGRPSTVRDKFLGNVDYRVPVAEFASSFAVQFSLITDDEYIVMSKRATEGIVGYPGCLAPAVNENLDPEKDKDERGNILIWKAAERGARDELHVKVTRENLKFLCIGVATQYYMYTLIGFAKLNGLTCNDVISQRSIKTGESWEVSQIYTIPNDPFLAAKEMRKLSKEEEWAPYGIVCVTRTLISQHGYEVCARAFEEYPPARQYGLNLLY